jgi:MinD-like ATPase involved in chromosome partitioning or flagellar assembly
VTQSEPDPEQPDGAVRRYVREQWDTDTSVRRSRRRTSSTVPPSPGPRSPGPQHATPAAGLGVVRPAPDPVDTDSEPGTVERAAGPDIVRSDGAGPHVVPDLPRVPEARSASDHAANKAPWTPPRGVGRWVEPGAMAAQEAQRARSGVVSSGIDGLPSDLSSARLLRPAKRPPQTGWRRLVYVLSGKLINPGESPADIHRRELIARINAPLLGCHKIALLSLKGGVGKTTMTATLGASFASLRGDRVVAVDANPDRGTLSQKIPLETSATVRHLLRDAQRVRRYTDVRAYTSQGASRLEVLASEQDPAVSVAFSEDDYRRTVNLLEHFYNMVLTDCGTGLMHSAMYGVLGVADQIVVVSSGSIDGARSASATMDWLDAHGHGDLVRNAVVVINCVSRSAGGVDLDRVAEHFAGRCRAVVRIPFDPHLQEGAEVDLDRLDPRTRLGLLELAAEVADAFPS